MITDTLTMLVNGSDMDLNARNRTMAAAAHSLRLYCCLPLVHSTGLCLRPLVTRIVATQTTHLVAAWSCTICILWDLEADPPCSEN